MFSKAAKIGSVLIFFPFLLWSQASQTFNGGGVGVIPDDQQWHYYYLNIPSLNSYPLDTNWGFEKATINITHTWDSDLEVWVGSPDGTEVLLFSGVGGDGDNFTNTAFSNNYTTAIESAAAPFTGNFKPAGDLGMLNNGQTGIGNWYLKIRDSFGQDEGTLTSWSLRFSNDPSIPYPPFSSNLPIIKINTHNQAIPDDPKIAADFTVIDNGIGQRNYSNDSVYAYHGNIGIELRGSSSGSAPKKSYGFETWDNANNEIDTSLLGMPAESDWILSASYYDKSLMRNVLAYHLANQGGQYASRTRYCEVILNGQYQGIYILMEKIKRDDNRVDIAKLDDDDTTGANLTGGYILKIDKFTGSGGQGWYSNYPPANPSGDAIFFQYEYPKGDEILPQQQTYIQKYVDSFETALFGSGFQDPDTGFRKYFSEKSLIDYMFINEMSKNVDGYRLSTYFYKDKNEKLRIGPAWDFDIAWFNANYCNAYTVNGWAYDLNYVCAGNAVPAWWERLRQDTLFNQHIYCRWSYLRSTVFSNDSLFAFIDSTANYIDEAQQRNFTIWNILGVGTWPEPTPLPQTYAEEVQRLKDWITNRFAWLDLQFSNLSHYSLDVTLGKDTTICSGNSVQLFAGDYDSYEWNTNETTASVYATQSGSYAVTVSDKFNCTGNAAVNINTIPAPDATIQTLLFIDAAVQFASVDTAGSTSTWYFGNGDSSTLHNPFYNYYPDYGYFLVTHILTDSLGCSSTDTLTVYIYNVGIHKIPESGIRIYPNPAKDELTVYSILPLSEISVYDALGNLCLSSFISNSLAVINISNLSSGIYFLEAKTTDRLIKAKFIKQ